MSIHIHNELTDSDSRGDQQNRAQQGPGDASHVSDAAKVSRVANVPDAANGTNRDADAAGQLGPQSLPLNRKRRTLRLRRDRIRRPTSQSPIIPVRSGESPTVPMLEITEPDRRRGLIGFLLRVWNWICRCVDWLFGVASMVVGLAVLATIPILQFLSLGYLLELSARVARSGRLVDGFIGIERIRRVGSIVLGTWLAILPLRLMSNIAYSSQLINGEMHAKTRGWRFATAVIGVALVAHILWAWYRGGRFRHFLWPAPRRFMQQVLAGGWYVRARDNVCDFLLELRLPYYFSLGFRGFIGAFIWLFVPVSIMVASTRIDEEGPAAIVALLGGLLLGWVLLYLPFLQTHFAAENRFRAMFEVREIRSQFRRAPIAYFVGLFFTLVFAVPLYLLKAELIPREAAWLPSLVFVLSILPARFLVGWAVSRARKREEKRAFVSRWGAFLAGLPVVAAYVIIVFATQYISWYGGLSLFEQHAFMLPVPFFGY